MPVSSSNRRSSNVFAPNRTKRSAFGYISVAIVIVVFISLVGWYYSLQWSNRALAASTTIMLRTNPIAFAEPEIPNPMRGYYKWSGVEIVPNVDIDVYRRFSWRQLEPSEGQYDFSLIEQGAREAQSRGGKFSFRVYSFCTSYCANGSPISVPDYVKDRMPTGWWYSSSGTSAYVPDWNSEAFLARSEALLTALGQRYNQDRRVGWLDIGIYGNWGEWHTWPIAYPSSSGAQQIDSANAERVIKAHMRAFSNKRLVFRMNNKFVINAMQLSPAIGLRDDGFGNSYADEEWKNYPDRTAAMGERWKTAPVVGEFWANSQDIDMALRQAKEYHFSAIGNGNRDSAVPPALMDGLVTIGKTLGYRYQLNSVTLPAQIVPGAAFSVTSSWSNVGVAPIYERWNVMVQLRDPATGAIAWQAASGLDLQKLLPTKNPATGADAPAAVVDTFQLPSGVRTGTYDLVVAVVDPDGYYRPLSLAIAGKRPDGSYLLGQVRVADGQLAATPTPPPATPTSTPSAPTSTPPAPTSTPSSAGILPVQSVTASTAQAENPPAGTLDRDLATRWSAYGDKQSITYDLGSSKLVSYVKIAFFRGDVRRAAFEIQLSGDGAAWSTLYSGRSSGTTLALQKFAFTQRQARYVRIVGHGNDWDLWNSFTEVQVGG